MNPAGGHFQDLRELGKFIASFWGALAAVSVLLPLINSWVGFIPRHPTIPTISTVLACLAALFAFLYTYVEGEEEGAYVEDPTGYRRRAPTPHQPTLRNAFGRFVWAILAFAIYLTLIALYGYLQVNTEGPANLISVAMVPVLLITYVGLFGFLTAALGTLAVVHWINALRLRLRGPIQSPEPDEDAEVTQIYSYGDGRDERSAADFRIDEAH